MMSGHRPRILAMPTVLALAALAAVSGCKGSGSASVGVTAETGGRVDESHAAVQAVLGAFDSGEMFTPDFHLLDPEKTTTAEARAELNQSLEEMKAVFAPGAELRFVDGFQWHLTGSAPGGHVVLAELGGDSRQYMSTFRLTSKQRRQVYLIFAAPGRNGETLHMHALLWPSAGTWRAAGVQVTPGTIGGMDFDQALAAAESADAADRRLLALALYRRAGILASGPPYRKTGRQYRVSELLGDVIRRYELPEKPLATVTTEQGTVELVDAGTAIVGDGVYIAVFRLVDALMEDEAAMRAHQQRIAQELFAGAPYLAEYFDGIGVNEIVRDTQSGYRSLYPFELLRSSPGSGDAVPPMLRPGGNE